jgi:hypothetical protein
MLGRRGLDGAAWSLPVVDADMIQEKFQGLMTVQDSRQELSERPWRKKSIELPPSLLGVTAEMIVVGMRFIAAFYIVLRNEPPSK